MLMLELVIIQSTSTSSYALKCNCVRRRTALLPQTYYVVPVTSAIRVTIHGITLRKPD